ncbi:MAG: LysM peptidoglycan-binding domain-containing protein, partial [Lachnospiraceae bacterium]|nr:LysM peptidoglycan-binding domain-containing protein [Lachnospiraceae bacterium]
SYTVQSGDCLWNIAKMFYNNGSDYTIIYDANASLIESTAQEHGLSSSSNGHWIYPGTVLTIPAA